MKAYHIDDKEPDNVKVCPSCNKENNKRQKFVSAVMNLKQGNKILNHAQSVRLQIQLTI